MKFGGWAAEINRDRGDIVYPSKAHIDLATVFKTVCGTEAYRDTVQRVLKTVARSIIRSPQTYAFLGSSVMCSKVDLGDRKPLTVRQGFCEGGLAS
jgi:hypothetical protein